MVPTIRYLRCRVGSAFGGPALRLPPLRCKGPELAPMAKEVAQPILSSVPLIRVGSESRRCGSTAPSTSEPKFCASPNVKKFNKNKFLYILTFAATMQCITLVATTLLINETLNNLDKTTTPSSRPMTSGPMMWVSRPGKWSSMLTEDKALRAIPVRRLEGHNGATKSEIRERI